VSRLAIVLSLALVLLAGCGGGSTDTAPEPAPAPTPPATTEAALPQTEGAPVECTEEEFPDQGAEHFEAPPLDFEYNSFPATSGPHAHQTIIWDIYTEPLPEFNLVHNLEHGGIVVQFGESVSADDVEALFGWYVGSPDGLVVAPLPELGDKVAATAWQHLLTCTGFDEGALTAFRDAYRFNGPEKIPPEAMRPGNF
jgi:hypothetical protein